MMRIAILLQFLLVIINYIEPIQFYIYISLSLYVMYLYLFFKKKTVEFIAIFHIILLCSAHIIGVFICETRIIYLYEIIKDSYFKGSFIEITFLTTILFNLLKDNIKKEDFQKFQIKKINKINEQKIFKVSLMIFLYNLYYFLLFLGESAYSLGMNRIDYYYYKMNPCEKYLFLFLCAFYMVSFYLFLYTNKKRNKVINLFSCCIVFGIYILSGAKSGEILYLMYITMFVSLFFKNYAINKIIKIVGFCLLTLMIAYFFHYKILFKIDGSEIVQKFEARIAQQGQLWWGTYDHVLEGKIEELPQEVMTRNEFNIKDVKEQKGIWKIMLLNSNEEIIKKNYNSKSRYTASSNASINYYFGFIGNIIFMWIVATIISKIYKFWIFIIRKESLKYLVFGSVLVHMAYMTEALQILLMSDFYWRKKFIFLILVMCFTLRINKENKEKNKRYLL